MIKIKKSEIFLNLIYQNGMIPTINKPTRVTRATVTAIDHILTNSFADRNFKTAIFKSFSYFFHNYIIIT